MIFRGARAALAGYVQSPDALAARANAIALAVASNQPFYPAYVRWFVGDDGWISLLTFLSTPFFLIVPAVTRKSVAAGRALLPVAGAANTLFCAKLFGQASGVEIFLAPCLIIAILSFRRAEKWWAIGACALVIAPFLALHDRYSAPARLFTPAEYENFRSMNAISAAMLSALSIYVFIAARRAARRLMI